MGIRNVVSRLRSEGEKLIFQRSRRRPAPSATMETQATQAATNETGQDIREYGEGDGQVDLDYILSCIAGKDDYCSSSENPSSAPRVVYFGEYHHQREILKAQLLLLDGLAKQRETAAQKPCYCTAPSTSSGEIKQPKLHVVFEMFNFNHQAMLDAFIGSRAQTENNNAQQQNDADLDALREGYISPAACVNGVGESFDLNHYGLILELLREWNQESAMGGAIKVHGGFIPKGIAKGAMGRHAADQVWDSPALNGQYESYGKILTKVYRLDSFQEHFYNAFQYRFTQELLPENNGEQQRKYEKIFHAQLMKDSSMAWKVSSILESPDFTPDCRVVVLAGVGHVEFGCCVPEGVRNRIQEQKTYGGEPLRDLVISCVPNRGPPEEGEGEEEESLLLSDLTLNGAKFADYYINFDFQ
eukprot:Nk52_evm1s2217 gene=Nk52_evmTU1s2217